MLAKQHGGPGGHLTLRRGLTPVHSEGGRRTGTRTGHRCWRLKWSPRLVNMSAASTGLAPCCRGHGRGQLAQLAAVRDNDLLGRLPTPGAKRFYFLHNIHSLFDVAKHDMFAVQPVSRAR